MVQNKDRSDRRKTEQTQKNINLLQEKIIEDPRISVSKNRLDISKSTFNRVTKRDLKWNPYKMQVRKERIINEVDLQEENQDLQKENQDLQKENQDLQDENQDLHKYCKKAKEGASVFKEMKTEISRSHIICRNQDFIFSLIHSTIYFS